VQLLNLVGPSAPKIKVLRLQVLFAYHFIWKWERIESEWNKIKKSKWLNNQRIEHSALFHRSMVNSKREIDFNEAMSTVICILKFFLVCFLESFHRFFFSRKKKQTLAWDEVISHSIMQSLVSYIRFIFTLATLPSFLSLSTLLFHNCIF
jgi:hypothetical protein